MQRVGVHKVRLGPLTPTLPFFTIHNVVTKNYLVQISIVPRLRSLGLQKTSLDVELLCQRICASIILLNVTKLFSTEVVPINIHQGHVRDVCFLKSCPILLSYFGLCESDSFKKWYLNIIYLHFCYCSEFEHLFICLGAIYIPFVNFSIISLVFSLIVCRSSLSIR